MNKKYENQLLQIIEKGVQERVFSVDSTFTDAQRVLKNKYENHLYMLECVRLFWSFEEKYDKIATQDEYVQAYKHYNDVMCNEYQDVVKADSYKDVLNEKDLAIKMIQGRLRSEQEVFIKSVLRLGVEQTKQNLGLNAQTFNNRLNRTIKAIEVANKRDNEKVG